MIVIDKDFIEPVILKARLSERKRTNYNFHEVMEDTLQRMLNVLNTGTYVRPHKHENPDKREAFVILEGRVAVVEFNNQGVPVQCIILDIRNKVYGCEIAAGKWHTIICLEDNSVLYEVKDGPYHALSDKNFAPWAPAEGNAEALDYMEKLLKQINKLS